MSEDEAAQFEAPFEYAKKHVLPVRQANNRLSRVDRWYRHGEARPGLRSALNGLARMIVTIETSKHRYFMWLPTSVDAEHKLVVIPRADDTTFGILSSRIHVVWVLRKGSTLEDRPVYTTGEVFAKFPFPAGLTPRDTASAVTEKTPTGAVIPSSLGDKARLHAIAIADAAKRLNDDRQHWLNPVEWTDEVAEVVPLGMSASPFPARREPKTEFAQQLKLRTMTKLYNEPPAWLLNAHEQLDKAVAAAFGWHDYTSATTDDEILTKLLALNLERAAA